MSGFLSGIFLFFVSFLAYAIDKEPAAVQLPSADPTAMIAFAVIFFGGIGATVWYMWKNEKNRKQREDQQK